MTKFSVLSTTTIEYIEQAEKWLLRIEYLTRQNQSTRQGDNNNNNNNNNNNSNIDQ